jgi:hypothetical protein
MVHTTLGFWGYWIVQLSSRAHNSNDKHDSAALQGRNYAGNEILSIIGGNAFGDRMHWEPIGGGLQQIPLPGNAELD